MWSKRFRRVWVIAVGSVLGLVAVQAAPDVAQAGGVEVVSHGWHGSGGAWGGSPHWGRRDHDARRWGGHDRWGARHHHWRWRDHGPHGFSSPWHAPVYIPPRWVWSGYGWVLVPGDWR